MLAYSGVPIITTEEDVRGRLCHDDLLSQHLDPIDREQFIDGQLDHSCWGSMLIIGHMSRSMPVATHERETSPRRSRRAAMTSSCQAPGALSKLDDPELGRRRSGVRPG